MRASFRPPPHHQQQQQPQQQWPGQSGLAGAAAQLADQQAPYGAGPPPQGVQRPQRGGVGGRYVYRGGGPPPGRGRGRSGGRGGGRGA